MLHLDIEKVMFHHVYLIIKKLLIERKLHNGVLQKVGRGCRGNTKKNDQKTGKLPSK